MVQARWREGFCLDDFKRVIDLKAAEWLEEPQFCRYLRPETLFGPKFESYLNQKSKRENLREADFDLED
ncbi:conserved phage C-terminal domain-containing protein [Neobacillus drentensis]|uniref:conserved phage C-terminal domain-containing protein n=1 Tax=Neobacillus drentensis TaxID=220684 RepID=UPI002FFEE843